MKSNKIAEKYGLDDNMSQYYATRREGKRKNRRISNFLLGLSVFFIIVAIVLLLIDPIKNRNREKTVEDAVEVIEEGLFTSDIGGLTYVVPKDANKINGEEYDVYGDEINQAAMRKELEQAFEELPDNVTLQGLGLIEIESIDCKFPIWDNDTVIDLRYGIGHHRTSVLPGEEGNCCLLGHHMRVEGMFFNRLIEVKIGDTVKITTPNREGEGYCEYVYTVDDRKIVDPAELEDYVDADDGTGKQITLISCTYTDSGTMRIIVIGHITEGED